MLNPVDLEIKNNFVQFNGTMMQISNYHTSSSIFNCCNLISLASFSMLLRPKSSSIKLPSLRSPFSPSSGEPKSGRDWTPGGDLTFSFRCSVNKKGHYESEIRLFSFHVYHHQHSLLLQGALGNVFLWGKRLLACQCVEKQKYVFVNIGPIQDGKRQVYL